MLLRHLLLFLHVCQLIRRVAVRREKKWVPLCKEQCDALRASQLENACGDLNAGKATFTPAQQELSKVVCEYQRAVHAGSVYNILDEIKPVLDHIAAENTSSGPVGVADLLAILKAQHAAVRNARSNAPGGAASLQSQRAALTGSLGYMEGAYLKLMEQRVRSNRQTAMAGGTGSLSALIQGFIMASSRQPGSGGAVLVPPSRQSVAWQQVRLELEACIWGHMALKTSATIMNMPHSSQPHLS